MSLFAVFLLNTSKKGIMILEICTMKIDRRQQVEQVTHLTTLEF